jgi:ABC-type multidrug transport system ATPase subunit
MSGGERSRARLAGLLASAKNLLVLDEPTNHLDIPSAERLEEALAKTEDGGTYDGTLILISHDRALIDATCDHLLILDGQGNTTVFLGNYSDWQRKQREAAKTPATTGWDRKQPAANAKPAAKSNSKPAQKPSAAPQPTPAKSPEPVRAPAAAPSVPSKGPKKGGKHSWMPVDRLESEIQAQTAKLQAIDDDLAKEEVYRDAKKFQALLKDRETQAAELAAMEEEWLRRAEA